MHKAKTDSRGWGRYVMREMLGKSGVSMVVVSLYLPTRSGARKPGGGAWDWQVQQIPLFFSMEISARWTPDWKRGGRCGRYGG